MTKLQATATPITDIEPPDKEKFRIVSDRTEDQIEKAKKILNSGMIKPNNDFDLDTLPGIVRDYIKSCKGNTLSSNALFLGAVLTMFSGFIKRKRYIPKFQPERPGCEEGYFNIIYPNLWILTIAPSGAGKTTAINRVLEYGRKHFNGKEYKNLLGQLGDDPPSEKQKELEKLENCRFEIPQPGSGQALLQSQSKGLTGTLVYNEYAELASLISRKEDNLKPVMTNLYDYQQVSRSTITHGLEIIDEPFLSILATSTLKWVTDYVSQDDIASGYLARWLIFYPDQEIKKPDALPSMKSSFYNKTAIKHAKQAIEAIIQERESKKVWMTKEAKEIFAEYHTDTWDWLITSYQGEQLDLMRSWVMRWYPAILKVAMVLQYIKDYTGVQIDAECMRAATHIVEFSKQSTTFLFRSDLCATTQQKNQDTVLNWIANRIIKHKKNPTRKDLGQSGKLKRAEEYNEALEGLVEAGIIEELSKGIHSEIRLK